MDKFKSELIENAIYRIDESTRMIKITFGRLSEDDIWRKPNHTSNSIGNLILHICGNMTQYVIASLGEKPDTRNRDAEFSMVEGFTKDELLQRLITTMNTAKATIENATADQFLKVRPIQAFKFSGVGLVVHAVEHYSYHTGQIAFWTKVLKDKDLGFYDGLDLTVTKE